MQDMTKFMKMTNWLRERRERAGGGVPACDRSASLRDFATMGRDCMGGWPGWFPPAGSVVIWPLTLGCNGIATQGSGQYGKIFARAERPPEGDQPL
jgi:hypothetical protein